MLRACAIALSVSLASCEAVPDLTFAEAGANDGDSGAGGGDGAAITDGSGARDVAVDVETGADAPASSVCPSTPPPPGVTACCGTVACVDVQTPTSCNCGDCLQQNCGSSGKICCFDKNGNLGCKNRPSDCK